MPLEPKVFKTASPCSFLLLWVGEGEGEAGVLGARGDNPLAASSTSSSALESLEYSTSLPSGAAFLAAQVPGGLALSPGEALEGLADVNVGLDGL